MKRTTSEQCHHEGCKEWGRFEYDTVKECRDTYDYRQKWKCLRHSETEEWLTPNGHDRVKVLTCVKEGEHFYWHDGKRLSSGFAHGNGYRAYASEFPAGTTLTITAHIALPEGKSQP